MSAVAESMPAVTNTRANTHTTTYLVARTALYALLLSAGLPFAAQAQTCVPGADHPLLLRMCTGKMAAAQAQAVIPLPRPRDWDWDAAP